MHLAEYIGACIPAYVYGLIWARRYLHKAKHSRCLANIRRLERELGMGGAPRSPLEAATRWQAAAQAKAANYGQGISFEQAISRSTAFYAALYNAKRSLKP